MQNGIWRMVNSSIHIELLTAQLFNRSKSYGKSQVSREIWHNTNVILRYEKGKYTCIIMTTITILYLKRCVYTKWYTKLLIQLKTLSAFVYFYKRIVTWCSSNINTATEIKNSFNLILCHCIFHIFLFCVLKYNLNNLFKY